MIAKKEKIKNFIRRLTGFEVVPFGVKYIGFVHSNDAKEAWFSYNIQLREILKEFEIDLIINVGASYGNFATMLRNFYDRNIISFEPVSYVFQELEKRASKDLRWNTYNFALGNENSIKEIYLWF